MPTARTRRVSHVSEPGQRLSHVGRGRNRRPLRRRRGATGRILKMLVETGAVLPRPRPPPKAPRSARCCRPQLRMAIRIPRNMEPPRQRPRPNRPMARRRRRPIRRLPTPQRTRRTGLGRIPCNPQQPRDARVSYVANEDTTIARRGDCAIVARTGARPAPRVHPGEDNRRCNFHARYPAPRPRSP